MVYLTYERNTAESLLKSPIEQLASGLAATAEISAKFSSEFVMVEATTIIGTFYDGRPVPVPSA